MVMVLLRSLRGPRSTITIMNSTSRCSFRCSSRCTIHYGYGAWAFPDFRERAEYCFGGENLLRSGANSVSSANKKNSVSSPWHTNKRPRGTHWALSPGTRRGQKKLTELGVWNRALRNRIRPISELCFVRMEASQKKQGLLYLPNPPENRYYILHSEKIKPCDNAGWHYSNYSHTAPREEL